MTLTKAEDLVAFEFLARVNESEPKGLIEDQAEQKILWLMESQLEKQLIEPFLPNYKEIIDNARNNIRNEMK